MSLVAMLLVQARIAICRQQWAAAHATLESALSLARAMRSLYAEARALYIYGLLHTQQGEVEPARARVAAALAILHRLGERLYGEHIERALADLTPR